MSRYRYESWPAGDDIPGRTATLDEAIEEAKAISVRSCGRVAVTDRDSRPALLRGVAVDGTWSWAVPCRTCKGTGRESVHGTDTACRACWGKGRRPERV